MVSPIKRLWPTKKERETALSVATILAIPMVLVVLIPITFGLVLIERESDHRLADIQSSRAEIAYAACISQNERHDQTIKQLNRLIAARKEHINLALRQATTKDDAAALRDEIDRIEASRISTITLIEALAPSQKCDQISMERFGFVPEINNG